MVSYRKLALVLLCVGGMLVINACRKQKKVIEPPQREKHKPNNVEGLLSKDGEVIHEVQNELLAARKHLITRLIGIIKEKENRTKNQASVHAAILILGEIRALEAIEALVEYIGFPRLYETEAGIISVQGGSMLDRGLKGIGNTYPAVQALINIGEPCLDNVIDKLSLTDHLAERTPCLAVLVGLRQRHSVIDMLKEAMNKEGDTKKRDRLQSSLDLLIQMEE